MKGFLKGSATAMITPFTEDGVNFDAFGKMIEYQIENGTDALVVLGTTGEPATMSDEEKEAVMRFAVKACAGRVKLIFGTGGNNTAKAVRMTRLAEEIGADGILAVTPYYNKCTQNGLIEYYKTICGATKLPVICYNVPSRTGVNILPETMEKIADIPNMAGIKEASGNMAQVLDTAMRIRYKCDLYSGEDALNLPILCVGGTAVISVVSNLVPAQVKLLTKCVANGDLTGANNVNDTLLPLIHACFSEVNPIPVKAGMNILGFDAGVPRAPLTPLELEHCEQLRKAIQENYLEVNA